MKKLEALPIRTARKPQRAAAAAATASLGTPPLSMLVPEQGSSLGEQLVERLLQLEWGLSPEKRQVVIDVLLGIITSPDTTPAQKIGAVMALVETQKLDRQAIDQLIKCGALQELGKRNQRAPITVDDADVIEGLNNLVRDLEARPA